MRIPTKAIKSTFPAHTWQENHSFQEIQIPPWETAVPGGPPGALHIWVPGWQSKEDPWSTKDFTCLNPFVCNGAWVPGCPLSLNRSDPGEELLCGWLQAGAGAVPSCSGWRESQGPSSAPTVTHTTSAATQSSHSTTTKWADEQSAIFYQNKT